MVNSVSLFSTLILLRRMMKDFVSVESLKRPVRTTMCPSSCVVLHKASQTVVMSALLTEAMM